MKRFCKIYLLFLFVCCSLGCNYGEAVGNNLAWGGSGLIENILVNRDLSGVPQWIIGALINGALNLL